MWNTRCAWAPPPGKHLGLFWQKKKHPVFSPTAADKTSHALKLFLKLGKWCIRWRSAQSMPFFGKWEILEPFSRGTRNTLTKPCSKRAQGSSTCLWVMMVLYCTTLLHTCLSTASSLMRRPLVFLFHWLVITCCVTSITGIFAACPSLSRPNISTGEINCFYRYIVLNQINILLVQYGKCLCT